MNDEQLERKLKRERVELCLNCKRFVKCHQIGEFEECPHFEEVEDEAWVIKSLDELELLDLVTCQNCELRYSGLEIESCPRCGWNEKKHSF